MTGETTIKKLQTLLQLDNSNKPIQKFVAENNINLSFLMILLVGQVIALLHDITPMSSFTWRQLVPATSSQLGCVSRVEVLCMWLFDLSHRTVTRLQKGAFQEDKTQCARAYAASACIILVSVLLLVKANHMLKPRVNESRIT